jgi:hypothetical protein
MVAGNALILPQRCPKHEFPATDFFAHIEET